MKYFNEIQRIICAGERIPVDQIKILHEKTRKREIVLARQLVMYFLRIFNGRLASWAKIGACYEKDHATAMHAFKAITYLKDTDRIAAARIQLYELQIKSIIDFEKNLMIDNFETTKARLKQLVDDNVPITYELVTVYNSLLEKTIKPG